MHILWYVLYVYFMKKVLGLLCMAHYNLGIVYFRAGVLIYPYG